MEILGWILQGVLAAVFLMAGGTKLMGAKMHVENFTKWGLPQWFRSVTGLVEVAAAMLLIIGFWQADLVLIGALLLVACGVGGVITHMRVKDSMKDTMPIGVLGLIALVLVIIVL